MMFASRILYLFIFLFAPLVSSESIQSRALRVYSFSTLIENIECDSRTDVKKCSKFTLYHIYAFAARVPPSGAGGYITDEPGFACNHVEPPSDNTVEWAALVYYSPISCDCSYEEKIVHVQAAGYKIALLVESGPHACSDVIGNNDTDVTNITIPAVLLSATVGLLLLRYSSPTDARPFGSVIVEALYAPDPDYKVTGIVLGSIFGPILIIFILIAVYFACKDECTCPRWRRCFDCIEDMECTCPRWRRCFDCIKDMKCTCPHWHRCLDCIKDMKCTCLHGCRCFDCIKDMERTCHCTARPNDIYSPQADISLQEINGSDTENETAEF